MLLACLIGACLGSFLNVVVYRLPRGESLMWPGSRCPRCATPLRAVDNVPLLSYLLLGARCRFCGAPIPVRYPVVELIGALLSCGAYLRWGVSWVTVGQMVCLGSLVAAAIIDLDTFVIPDSLCAAVAIGGIALGWVNPSGGTLLARFLAGAVGAGALWGLAVVSRGGMGLGDAKLVGAMGLALGPRDLVIAFAIAVSLGAAVGVGLLVARARTRSDPLPFGPFLVMGGVTAGFLGEGLAAAYVRTFAGVGAP